MTGLQRVKALAVDLDPNNRFGRRLAEARKRKQMTARQLAARVGVRADTIAHVECGRMKSVKLTALPMLCAILECSADYLLGLTDCPIPADKLNKHNMKLMEYRMEQMAEEGPGDAGSSP